MSHDTMPSPAQLDQLELILRVQSNDKTGPLRAARWSPYFLVLSSGEGMFYSADEYASWMRKAGFIDVEQVSTPMDHAIVVGRRP